LFLEKFLFPTFVEIRTKSYLPYLIEIISTKRISKPPLNFNPDAYKTPKVPKTKPKPALNLADGEKGGEKRSRTMVNTEKNEMLALGDACTSSLQTSSFHLLPHYDRFDLS
jgi:hypothetical protein